MQPITTKLILNVYVMTTRAIQQRMAIDPIVLVLHLYISLANHVINNEVE
jgi:hypothetical protein